LFTHNAKWQREGFASNLTLVINLYHWVAKGQLFHDNAIFSSFKKRKIGQGVLKMGFYTAHKNREGDQWRSIGRGGGKGTLEEH